jgi:sodium/potassium-transporting ATPase subunit alpha
MGTELMPAISLVYEKSESDIMSRPPRRAKEDRLISPQVIGYSYLQAGSIIAAVSFLAYFMVFENNGVPAY